MNTAKEKMIITAELDSHTLCVLKDKFDIVLFGRATGNKSWLDERSIIQLLRRFADVNVMIVGSDSITSKCLDEVKSLTLIACTRGNPVNIDLEACKARGITVINTPSRNANAVAEFTIGLILCCARNILEASISISNGSMTIDHTVANEKKGDIIWNHPSLTEQPGMKFRGVEIKGKTLGLVGFGVVGQKVSEKARALQMIVLAYDPYVSVDVFKRYGVERVGFSFLLKNSDFVSLHAKSTDETKNLIDSKELSTMRRSAFLINTARGALINQDALFKVLESKKIAGAALDVFEQEPLFSDNPLTRLDNVILTPHIGGASSDVIHYHSKKILKDILR